MRAGGSVLLSKILKYELFQNFCMQLNFLFVILRFSYDKNAKERIEYRKKRIVASFLTLVILYPILYRKGVRKKNEKTSTGIHTQVLF